MRFSYARSFNSLAWERPTINNAFFIRKIVIHVLRPLALTLPALSSFRAPAIAQEVSIPDPGLNVAIREAP